MNSSLCSISLDCIHVATIEKLHKNYENIWQVCLAELDLFKVRNKLNVLILDTKHNTNTTIFSTLHTQTDVSAFGFTSDEIQNIVTVEILPLIGQCQSQVDVYLEKLDVSLVSLML